MPPLGSAPWRPRPHITSSQTTAMPRSLAAAMYAFSSFGGHGIAATEEPHCGSTRRTPISFAYVSRYWANSVSSRAWNCSTDSPLWRRKGVGTG